MRTLSSSRLLRALGACLLCSVASAQVPTYSVRFVGDGWVPSINEHGQVTANRLVGSGWQAWSALPGAAPVVLPMPPGATSVQAHDINNQGWIVGEAYHSQQGIVGVVWRPTGLGTWSTTVLSGTQRALAVNDLGDVVGTILLGGAFHWSEATGVTPLLPTGFDQLPGDVNNERVIVGGSQRMDLDTLVPEDLGVPTGTGYGYQFVTLSRINDAGQCGGWAAVATSLPDHAQSVRFTDGAGWKAFHLPVPQAGVLGLDAAGNTLFAIGYSSAAYVYFEGQGTFTLGDRLAPGHQAWSIGLTYGGDISRTGEVTCVGVNQQTGQSGVVVLTPLGHSPEPLAYCTAKVNSQGCSPSIGWSGVPSATAPTGFVLGVSGALAGQNGIFFYSHVGPAAAGFLGGTLCVTPPTWRTPAQSSSGSGACAGAFVVDFSAWISGGPDPALTAGATFWVQHWSRDPGSPVPSSLSNALRVTLWP